MKRSPLRTRRSHVHACEQFGITEGTFVDLQGSARFDLLHRSPEDMPDTTQELGVVYGPRELDIAPPTHPNKKFTPADLQPFNDHSQRFDWVG